MLEELLINQVKQAVKSLYGLDVEDKMIQLQKTRPEFEGHITLVVFPFVKAARKAPAVVAEEIGNYLVESVECRVESNLGNCSR